MQFEPAVNRIQAVERLLSHDPSHDGGVGASRSASLVQIATGRIVPNPALALTHQREIVVSASASDIGGVAVLLVDDNEDAAEAMSLLLKLYGCDVRIATSAVAAGSMLI